MEKKTMDTLRTMICGELEDIAKNGIKSHENLDILKDLLDSAKNIEKIEKYQREKEEKEHETMDRGYSQRKYYIDADYDPYQPSMPYSRGARPMYDMQGGNSYAVERNRAADTLYGNGNSYMYYDPMYSQARYPMNMGGGYSGTNNNSEAIMELKQMMAEAPDEITKKAISDAITKLNK